MNHPAWCWFRNILFGLSTFTLFGTFVLLGCEYKWNAENKPQPTGETAFVVGSIGTELAPLPVFTALPKLFPEEFHPITAYFKAKGLPDPNAGDWIDQYGFIRSDIAPEPKPKEGLPVGFTLSHHRPGSGAPSPVAFVGLSCAACHSAEIRTDPNKRGSIHYGVGNPAMNLLAFSEAVRGVLLKRKNPKIAESEYVLTISAVEEANGKKLSRVERLMCELWLTAARSETSKYQSVIDTPYQADQLADYRFMMAGPARTQPFRSLVRIHLDRPGWWTGGHQMDQGFSKIPAVFHQSHKYHGEWAQFDGSISNITARSTLAASTAGANVDNLSLPDISSNIKLAAAFTEEHGPDGWKKTFPNEPTPNPELALKGWKVYEAHCFRCHGKPGSNNTWTGEGAADFGKVTPLAEIGTDGNRIEFRHKDEVAKAVGDKFNENFRKDHPLSFPIEQIRTTNGYYNGPIAGVHLRAPYLHNASVLTLAELIGLENRRDRFYRGQNAYDLEQVGFKSPEVPKDVPSPSVKPFDRHYYFLFDTNERGNSNRGHYYPAWGFGKEPPTPEQKEQLKALLEYLKTI